MKLLEPNILFYWLFGTLDDSKTFINRLPPAMRAGSLDGFELTDYEVQALGDLTVYLRQEIRHAREFRGIFSDGSCEQTASLTRVIIERFGCLSKRLKAVMAADAKQRKAAGKPAFEMTEKTKPCPERVEPFDFMQDCCEHLRKDEWFEYHSQTPEFNQAFGEFLVIDGWLKKLDVSQDESKFIYANCGDLFNLLHAYLTTALNQLSAVLGITVGECKSPE
ncbi:MAG: hypothetical protein ACRCV6_07760 [Formosimonas sp.]